MAETPGQQVDETISNVAAGAQSEIDAAAMRADDAQREAARIADAAISTDLGSRIQSTNERLEQWQSNSSQLESRLSSQEKTITEQGTLLGAIAGTLQSIQSALAPKQPLTDQPPASGQASGPTDGSLTRTEANARPEDQRPENQPPPPPKKRSFL